MRYELQCEKCGKAYPVETRQAGGEIECECGATLSIPTMLKMKRLPEWKETQDAKQDDNAKEQKSDATPTESANETNAQDAQPAKKKLSARRRALFVICSLVTIASLFVVGKSIKAPHPTAVFYKNTIYSLGDGRAIKRDTPPITMEDYCFYFATDFSNPNLPTAIINDAYVDYMSFYAAYQYFDYVKDLRMSDNFYDNYESIKTRRWLRLGLASLIAILALAGALFALFAPESTKQVGAMRGADWR